MKSRFEKDMMAYWAEYAHSEAELEEKATEYLRAIHRSGNYQIYEPEAYKNKEGPCFPAGARGRIQAILVTPSSADLLDGYYLMLFRSFEPTV
jgi:hypothetical protein